MACEFCNLSEEDRKWLLLESKYWDVYLADVQDYIGRSIVVSKCHRESLSALTLDEWLDLQIVIKSFEMMLKKEIAATMFNWSCLMNNSYKEKEACPHVHFHVRPRYEKPVLIGEKIYIDEEFGHHYDNRKENVEPAFAAQIYEKLKKNVSKYFV